MNYPDYSINLVQGSIHQGSETFSEPSRRRQCAFLALSALFHNESVTVHSWTKSVIDQIFHHGDAMEIRRHVFACVFKVLSTQ